MFAEELLKGRQQLRQIEPAVGPDVPGRLKGALEVELSDEGKLAGDDFAVDGIGDLWAKGCAADQAEVGHVAQVILADRTLQFVPLQHRLDDPAHTRFLQLVGQLIQVRFAAQDQVLLRFLDHLGGDGPAAVAAHAHRKCGLVGQRIHQPGLTLCQMPDRRQRIRLEGLTGLRRVLQQQPLHLWLREVAQAQ